MSARWEGTMLCLTEFRRIFILVAVVLLIHCSTFYLASNYCWLYGQQYELNGYTDTYSGIIPDKISRPVLIMSDIHVLGKRKKNFLQRYWTDLQVLISINMAIYVHAPSLVLVLGDMLDEGNEFTIDEDYRAYTRRFYWYLNLFTQPKVIFVLGNHDTDFGRFMQPEEIARYENFFGPSNTAYHFENYVLISLNTMAMDSDVRGSCIYKQQAERFLNTISEKLTKYNSKQMQRVVLLTHLPLFRENDLHCGRERAKESGHVTYEHPAFSYAEHQHVLSRNLSSSLLDRLQPFLVLSGHTHAFCSHTHSEQGRSTTSEYTIPAFSWSQRPDPSYALLEPNSMIGPKLRHCKLPDERLMIALYVMLALAFWYQSRRESKREFMRATNRKIV